VFGATQDPSPFMNINSNDFVSVISNTDSVHSDSHHLKRFIDMVKSTPVSWTKIFALQWVQKNTSTNLVGDPKTDTVTRESSSAGAVMLQAIACCGKQDGTLFDNVRYRLATNGETINKLLAHRGQSVPAHAVQVWR